MFSSKKGKFLPAHTTGNFMMKVLMDPEKQVGLAEDIVEDKKKNAVALKNLKNALDSNKDIFKGNILPNGVDSPDDVDLDSLETLTAIEKSMGKKQ